MGKLISYGVMLCLIFSCSFKKKNADSGALGLSKKGGVSKHLDPKQDSDGDMITDLEEISRGLDPLVSNIPKIRVEMISQGSIDLYSKSLDHFVKKYSVGISLSELPFQSHIRQIVTRKVSKFVLSSDPNDLIWVGGIYGYLKVSDLSQNSLNLSRMNDFLFLNDIEFENTSEILLDLSFSLSPESGQDLFEKITDIDYTFFTESPLKPIANSKFPFYVSTDAVETKIIESIPPKTFVDSFLVGDDLIFKMNDFNIVYFEDLGKEDIKFSTLLESIRKKTVEVIKIAPGNVDHKFIAIGGSGSISVEKLIESISKKGFQFKDREIFSIDELENSSDLRITKDRIQKMLDHSHWYALNNRHQLLFRESKLTAGDIIVVAYMSGRELLDSSKRSKFKSFDTIGLPSQTHRVSQVLPNSKIKINLLGKVRHFDKKVFGSVPQYKCSFSYVQLKENKRETDFSKGLESEDIKLIGITIGKDEINLHEFSKKYATIVDYNDSTKVLSLEFDLSKIDFPYSVDSPLFLKTYGTNSQIQLGALNVSGDSTCPDILRGYKSGHYDSTSWGHKYLKPKKKTLKNFLYFSADIVMENSQFFK
ncbi:MAG: hypothetical protein HOE90_24650 [Bacteriovoracaceae bacterium]|jgi:hypothetical protein|nr:hypothetical protein [Bacteriovoracaceae bacterium]